MVFLKDQAVILWTIPATARLRPRQLSQDTVPSTSTFISALPKWQGRDESSGKTIVLLIFKTKVT